ncbi:MAG: hypothetical protein QM831_03735 [Kofleriaceae bacterium]
MNKEPLIPHDAAQTLAAGGIVMKNAKLPAEERTTAVAPRAYKHPALPPDRIIVRLEPEAVGEGTDAEMAAYGFGDVEIGAELGKVRYRTLGFPAWGLVNAPKAGKVALGVMEDVRKAKRMVAAKPGHAKEAFEKIAKTLQKASPQLLPSFWEEVGRTVADLASAQLAAQCFERARQAERAFKLKVDADDSDAVFLEFALLGALSAKTLSQYAKDLAKSEGGAEAYKRFRNIAVKRSLGGMPPWSGMGKDLRSLAKEAELDLDEEDQKLVMELLDAPSINKSPNEFWQTYRDALAAIGAKDESARTKLRNLWPDPKGQQRDNIQAFRDAWIQLLDDVGALKNIPDQGLGAWMSRLIHYAGGTPRVIAMLEELAPRLKDQAIQITVRRSRWGSSLSLDLAERALQLGVPLADDKESYYGFEPEHMSVDPVLVSEHPVYGPKLVEAVAEMIGNPEHERTMRGKKGFQKARAAWIEKRIDVMNSHPLTCSSSQLDSIEGKTTATSFMDFPALYEKLKASDFAGSLATQLRGGVIEEFTWPAFEAAVKDFAGPSRIGGAYPIAVIWNATKAIAVGPQGVVGEHDLVIKKGQKVEYVSYFGDQFFVVIETDDYDTLGYWSGAPKQQLELKNVRFVSYGMDIPVQSTLADGTITLSGKDRFAVGDMPKSASEYVSDGARFWTHEWKTKDGLVEWDPLTEKKLGVSAPEFFTVEATTPPPPNEDGTPGKWSLEWRRCELALAPAGYSHSPLGIANGLTGVRVRESGDNYQVTRIDGVEQIGTNSNRVLVTWPGDSTPRLVSHDRESNARFFGGEGPTINLLVGDDDLSINNEDWVGKGWPTPVPPLTFWHYFVPRDPAASAALRAVTVEQARALLAAPIDQREAKIRETFGTTDAVLVKGIAGYVERAAELNAKLPEIITERAKENADPDGGALTSEGVQLKKLMSALAAGRETKFKDVDVDPDNYFGGLRGEAMKALSPLEKAEERRSIKDKLRTVLATGLADDTAKLRYFTLEDPDGYEWPEDYDTVLVQNDGGSTFLVAGGNNWCLEYSRDGEWRVPKPFTVTKDSVKRYAPVGTTWARAYLELPDEGWPWDPQIATQLAARAGVTEAEAKLLYCGMPDGWGKDFLGKPKRTIIDLKRDDADAARTTYTGLDDDKKSALFEKAAPEAALLATPLAPGGYVDGLAREWKAAFGKKKKIPQDLVMQAKKELALRNDDLSRNVTALAGDLSGEWLKPDRKPLHELSDWGDDNLTSGGVEDIAQLIAWMFVQRKVGDEIRAGIPEVIDAITKVMDDKTVLWPLGTYWFSEEDAKRKTVRDGLFQLVGGKAIEQPKNDDDEACERAVDNGNVVLAQYKRHVYIGFRPANVVAARKQLETLRDAIHDAEDGDIEPKSGPIPMALLAQSDGFRAFAERVRETPVEDGQYEANPLQSVPKLVAKVAKAEDLSEEAAVLYLQLLTLAEPTEKMVQMYNGWTAKQYKAAAAELVKSKLVTEGKRERAGRSIFIKGGFSKGKDKNLPMEDWKAEYYSALDRQLPVEPIHQLFTRSWKRIEDGDKPA